MCADSLYYYILHTDSDLFLVKLLHLSIYCRDQFTHLLLREEYVCLGVDQGKSISEIVYTPYDRNSQLIAPCYTTMQCDAVLLATQLSIVQPRVKMYEG